MINLSERLVDLMEENHISVKDLELYLKDVSVSNIYRWLKGYSIPKLDIIFSLSNLFECSIEYLIGRTENYEQIKKTKIKKFSTQIEKVLKEKGVTHYRLLKDKTISSGNEYSLFYKNCVPTINSMIKLADYLGVSVDYLVGRV